MPVKAFLNSRFTTTHENQIFDELINRLNQRYDDLDELVILIGNFYCDGNEIDAMIVKHDSVSVIDFKNYGGKIEFSENDKWKADGTEIKGGNKRNPYIQIRTNKFTLLDYLKNANGIFEIGNQVNLGHISGIVLFHQPIQLETKTLPPRISSWFHITDINQVSQLIYQITSREINLSEKEILNIPKALKINEYFSNISSIKTKAVANNQTQNTSSKEFTLSQRNALKEIEIFLKDGEQQVVNLVGAVNSGKTYLIREIIQIIQAEQGNYELLAPSKRIAEILSRREQITFTSIYTKIYSGSPDKEKEKIKIEEEEFNLFRFPIRTNNDANDTIYIIDEAQLISDNFSRLDFFIFGSGKLLTDIKEFTQVQASNRKIILIGDDKQIQSGNSEQSALSNTYIETQLQLRNKQIELNEIIKQQDLENILDNAIEVRNAISKNSFNNLELIEDGTTIYHVDKTNFREHYERAILVNPFNTIIIRSTNKKVAEMNNWVRGKVLKRSSIIENGDYILLYNNIRISASPEYPDGTTISNGEFGKISYVSNVIEEPLPKGFKLKGRKNEIKLRFRDVRINFINLNKEVKVKISEDFLVSESPETNPDEFIALMALFSMRNPNLKRDSEEFVTAIRNDPYINAAKIKFGYAITGHKAQGYKWNNLFVGFETDGGKTNETFFRWVYTSITRTTQKLFLINPPFISPFINMEWKENNGETVETKKRLFHYNLNTKIDESLQSEIRAFEFSQEKPLLVAFYHNVKLNLSTLGIQIKNVSHKPYQEHYEFARNGDSAIVKFYYNGQFKFTAYSIINTSTKEFSESIIEKLYSVADQEEIKEIQLTSKQFLTDLFERLSEKLETTGIKISHVESKSYLELYTFIKEQEKVNMNFWYDGEGFFTTVMCQSSNSPLLVEKLMNIVNQLKPINNDYSI